MKANCWYGPRDVRVEDVADPPIINPRDVVIRITSSAICGSDLHLYNGFIPTMLQGDIMGHEFMGEIVEAGSGVTDLNVGDRVIVPFCIACGNCWSCRQGLTSLCENSNPNATVGEKLMGHASGGLFGYSHMTGGYAGGQAQYARVPYADFNCTKIPDGIPDEKVLFLTDIFPTGYMAAENCDIQPGDTVAVWGCGPVGQFAMKSAYMLGAERVDQDRPDARPPLRKAAPRPHPQGRDRSQLRDHPPDRRRRHSGRLPDVPQQGGRLHEGRHPAEHMR
jgi:threonine dehydrogenase-like Zn-dependent dehydrogenase